MAPTAAMLILSSHIKAASPPSLSPSTTASPTSSFGFKFSAAKWVQQDNTIFEGRYQKKKESSSSMVDPSLPAEDSALEEKFQESLKHSCWIMPKFNTSTFGTQGDLGSDTEGHTFVSRAEETKKMTAY
ncbi:conserved hypothetical protein [Ricinus communis]|uniref:Uncharacterized protein n=1 Tax=Ricinus communis TaxID=3988 RepID=B9RX31_RICCO|nr:conserved hypothetical protein [Ricinus communis]